MKAPQLITDRLVLRAFRRDDFQPYAAMWGDERVTAFIGGDPKPRDAAWRRFCQGAGLWSLIGYGYWLIVKRDTDIMVGAGGFANFERGIAELDGFPEAGWAFTADSWGKGYASEAVTAMLAWSDGALPGQEVRCIIDHGNIPSRRVAKKCGFVQIADIEAAIGAVTVFGRVAGGPVTPPA